MADEFKRKTPEEALKAYREEKRGRLKIFLGYSPGVGKTFSMLNEANRRLVRGENIIIGYFESHGRKETDQQINKLYTVPRKKIEYNGIVLEEMDTEAIIKQKPNIVLIDELAHTNVPGSKNNKRYEDVKEILESGINVITTLNIQHLESLNDVVRQITGIHVRETIPDSIVEEADEVVIIDITPDALQNRLKRGNIYKLENVDRSLKNFFRKGNLNALREIALRQTAEEVDEDLVEYMKKHGIDEGWQTVERIVVCISSNPYSKKLIRRGARMAKRYKCEWFVVFVDCTHIFAPKLSEKDKKIRDNHYKLAKELGAEIVNLTGKSISQEIATFANTRNVTQIVIGYSKRTKFQKILRGSTISRLLRQVHNSVEVHIIPDDF